MKFIWRYVWNKMRDVGDEERADRVYATSSPKLSRASDIEADEGLSIMVRKAMGGKIVTFRTYDNKHDRHQHRLYVIPDDHDFEKELGKLITLESMRL